MVRTTRGGEKPPFLTCAQELFPGPEEQVASRCANQGAFRQALRPNTAMSLKTRNLQNALRRIKNLARIEPPKPLKTKNKEENP